MKKYIVCILLMVSTMLVAAPVTKQQALDIAVRYASGSMAMNRASQSATAEVLLQMADQEGNPYLYGVNFGDGNGFVIVSGDDRTRQVLAYSDKGKLDNRTMPDNVSALLQGYVAEMRHLDAIGYQPQVSATRRAAGVKNPISPLIATTWDQGDPYNLQCPDDGGSLSVVGCVATAMAQVVYYHAMKSGMPEYVLENMEGYTTTSKKIAVPELVKENYQMAWSQMLADYSGDATDAQKAAVANLMRCCAQSVKMNFTSSSSGANSEDVAPALIRYFGMDNTTRLVYRSDYTIAQWSELIYQEIANGRPVCYSGLSAGGGHEFVIDGYDGDELFHVNWGWSGSSNGYFALSVLNPGDNSGIGASSTNDGYSILQDATIGIQYGSGESWTAPVMLNTTSLYTTDNFVYFTLRNATGSEQTFDVGLGMIDDENTLSVMASSTNGGAGYTLANGDDIGEIKITVATVLERAGKTYRLVPISKLHASDEWLYDLNPKITYVEVVYDAEGVPTLTGHPQKSLSASLDFTGNKYANSAQPVVVNIDNHGDEFYGTLYLFASTAEGSKGSVRNKAGVTIVKGGSVSTEMTFTPTAPGTYYVWVTTDSSGENVVAQSTVNIVMNANPPAGPMAIRSLTITGVDDSSWTVDDKGKINVNVYTNHLIVKPSVYNMTDSTITKAHLTFQVYRYNSATSEWVYQVQYRAKNPLTSVTSGKVFNYVELDFGELGFGDYQFRLVCDTNDAGDAESDYRYYISLVEGYAMTNEYGERSMVKKTDDTVEVPGNATAVNLVGLSFTDVTPNSNPNTLYYIGDVEEPAGLAGRNVVKAGNISELTITDGNPFYAPIALHADAVSYTRTFSKFYQGGKNWTTLVLPFAATEVRNDVKSLPWDEENREFWLLKFAGENNGSVLFTTPDDLEAYTPYIVALPGEGYGAYSLVGHSTLTFTATNVDIPSEAKAVAVSETYKLVGHTAACAEQDGIYVLNEEDDGDTFKKGTSAMDPFRAYFTPLTTTPKSQLSIAFVSHATGIAEVEAPKRTGSKVYYNLQGQRVAKPAKGIYIVNGRKISCP